MAGHTGAAYKHQRPWDTAEGARSVGRIFGNDLAELPLPGDSVAGRGRPVAAGFALVERLEQGRQWLRGELPTEELEDSESEDFLKPSICNIFHPLC
jgi:hypothetical protein